ncbi:hypothetical protein ACLOJK_028259 [Asimina triloba]
MVSGSSNFTSDEGEVAISISLPTVTTCCDLTGFEMISTPKKGGHLGLPDEVLPVSESDGEKASVVGSVAGVFDDSGLPKGDGLGDDDILGGSDPLIGPHCGGDRRWLPPSMVMVEHHTGAPLARCVLYTRGAKVRMDFYQRMEQTQSDRESQPIQWVYSSPINLSISGMDINRVVALGNLDLRIKYPVVNPKALRKITS